MVSVKKNIKMAIDMREIFKMVKPVVKGSISGEMVATIKV